MGRYKERLLAEEEGRRRPTTLADLRTADVGVFCWCNRCGHNAEAATAMLIAQLGPAFPVPEIGSRMRCSACGSKDIATRPSWPSQGQITRHL
jgi:hypothetical protein